MSQEKAGRLSLIGGVIAGIALLAVGVSHSLVFVRLRETYPI